MSALTLSGIIFVSTLGGIFLGTLLRRALPRHHLDEHVKDVVRLGVGLVATIAALVLGLLIAAAKSSFDTQTGQVRQITANLILLDNILAQYGPEARPVRDDLQRSLQSRAVQISNDLAQVRFLLFVESENLVPIPSLAVLAFWLMIIFASFSLFSPQNLTVFIFLVLFALSAACGIFLILELSRPFTGLMSISSVPLRNALGAL
jgi:hypothetical protein